MTFRTRVVSIPLALELRLFADAVSPQRILDLQVPELEGLLPHAEALQLHWLLAGVANNEMDWNVLAWVGWDRNHELPQPVKFFSSDQSTAGPQLAVPANFTSASWFRHARLQLSWGLHSGIASPKEARFSAVLYVTTKGN